MTVREVHAFLRAVRAAVDAAASGGPMPGPDAVPERLLGLVRCGPEVWRADGALPDPATRRVAILSREYPDETLYGGMGTFAHRLACGLHALGDRVVVITEATRGSRIIEPDGFPVIRLQTDPTVRALGGILGPLLFSAAAAVQLDRIGGADVIDVADFAAEGLWAVQADPGRCNVRCYSPWSLLGTMRIDPHAPRDLRAAFLLERWTLRAAGAVDAGSADLARRVADLFGLAGPVEVIPSPAPFPSPEVRVAERPRPAPDEPQTVCFIGRFDRRKGVQVLLDALPAIWRHHPGTRIRLVGSDPRGVLRARADLYADPRIEHHGHVTPSEAARLLTGCAVAVVPSLYDNAPLSLVEHLAAGSRVVATTAGGAPEYLAGPEHRLVAPRAPDALARAVVELLDRDRRYGPRDRTAPVAGPLDVARAVRRHHGRLIGSTPAETAHTTPPEAVPAPTVGSAPVEVIVDGRGATPRAIRATIRSADAAGARPVSVVLDPGEAIPLCTARVVRHPAGGDPLSLAVTTATMPRVVVANAGSTVTPAALSLAALSLAALSLDGTEPAPNGTEPDTIGSGANAPTQRAQAAPVRPDGAGPRSLATVLPTRREIACAVEQRIAEATDRLGPWHALLLVRSLLRRP